MNRETFVLLLIGFIVILVNAAIVFPDRTLSLVWALFAGALVAWISRVAGDGLR